MRGLIFAVLFSGVSLGLPSAGSACRCEAVDAAIEPLLLDGHGEDAEARAAAGISELEAATVRWPADPEAHRCLLEVFRALHDPARFMAALRRAAVSLAPLGNDAVDELIPYARAYWTENDLPHAREAFGVLVATYPGSGKAQSGYGVVLISQGELDEARTRFALALSIAPRDPIVVRNSAIAALLAGDFAQARPLYERLSEIEPKNTAVYFDLAALALADGPAAAIPAWERYLARHALVPDDPGIAKWAASLLEVLKHEPAPHGLDELAADLNRAQMGLDAIPLLVGLAQRDPKDPEHHYLLAQAYEQNHLPKIALAELRTAEALLRANPGFQVPRHDALDYEVGRVALEVGDADLAVEHLERETKARREHGDGLYTLGLAYLRQGRRDLAHASFERCLRAKEPTDYIEWCRKNAEDTVPQPAAPVVQ